MESIIRSMGELQLANVESEVTVSWKQGSFMGTGGDKSQRYRVCRYMKDDAAIPVFVQADWNPPQLLPVNNRLQWGINDGHFFMVLHDKDQTPYQHRFVQSATQQLASFANDLIKLRTKGLVDLGWVVGDYLHNI